MTSNIISAAQLLHASKPSWVLLDCRFDLGNPRQGAEQYRAGHIPGAHYLSLDEQLSGTCTGSNGRHPLPDAGQLMQLLGKLGVGPHTQVIAYDDSAALFAARAWWLLRWLGHEQVAVLDGGLAAYINAGGELTQCVPEPKAQHFSPQASLSRPALLAEIIDNLSSQNSLLVDARSPDRYRGQGETLDPVGGHIPGAINRFFRDNLDEQGCFLPAQQLRSDWLKLLDQTDASRIIHQCGSGVSACVNLLAMEIAGLSGSRLYPGSWSEWCSDRERPVAND